MKYTFEMQPQMVMDDNRNGHYTGRWIAEVYDQEWNWIIDITKNTYSAAYSAARRWIDKQEKVSSNSKDNLSATVIR